MTCVILHLAHNLAIHSIRREHDCYFVSALHTRTHTFALAHTLLCLRKCMAQRARASIAFNELNALLSHGCLFNALTDTVMQLHYTLCVCVIYIDYMLHSVGGCIYLFIHFFRKWQTLTSLCVNVRLYSRTVDYPAVVIGMILR